MNYKDKASLFGNIGDKIADGIRIGTKLTGKAVVEGCILTGKASVIGGKALKDGAVKVYDKIQQDKIMLSEIKEINNYCNSLDEVLEERKGYLERAFNRTVSEYTSISSKAFALADKYNVAILALPDGEQQHEFILECMEAEGNLKIKNEGLDSLVSGISQGIATGVAVGTATSVGLAATVGAFGTASTGTALASLHGAAFTNALLATLGGGSVASGGMGLLGGLFVLGSGVLIPAAVVSAWIADGNINKAYEEALTRKEKAKRIKDEATTLFDEYENHLDIFRRLSFEYEKFCNYFERFLSILPAVAKTSFVKEYMNLLDDAKNIIIKLDTFAILDDEGKVKTTLVEEFKELVGTIQKYQYNTNIFSYKLEQAKHLKLDTVIEDYDNIFKDLSRKFPHLDDISIGFLATSEVYRSFNKITRLGLLDQSAIVIGYAKSVEYSLLVLLKKKGYCPNGKKKMTLGEAYVKYFSKHRETWPDTFLDSLYQLKELRNEAAHPNDDFTENAGDVVRDILLGSGNYQGNGLLQFVDEALAVD